MFLSSSLSLPGLSSSASSQSSLSSSSSRYPSGTRDDFHLNLMPLSVPSMADNLFADSGFMFPPSYAEGHAQPPSLPHHHTHGHGQQVQRPMTAGEPSDFSSRYRVRADLLRRTGEQVGLGASSSSSYPDIRGPAWGGSSASGAWDSHSRYAEARVREDARPPPQSAPTPVSAERYVYGHGLPPLQHRVPEIRVRAGPGVQYGQQRELGGVDAFPGTAPNYLPSSTSHNPSPSPSQQFQHPTSFSIPDLSSTLPPISQSPSTTIPPQPFDESAFGALSLEDPALLAPDAPPFFSSLPSSALESPHDPGLTPTPAREGQGEADGELWRAFMRNTPVGEVARRGSYPQYAHGGYHHSHTPQNQDRRSPPPQQEQDLTRYQAAVLAHARETQPVLRAPPRRATGDGNTHTHTHTSTSTRLLSAHGIVGEHSRPGSAESSASESARSSVSESASSVGSGVGEARMGGFGVGSHGRMGGERGGEGTPMKVGVKRGLARVVGGEDLVLGGPEMKRRGTVGEGGVTP
ncbi:hypothetical protein DXG01_002164 [Tephrocybe rancida]|nr:hypothetical protein DXG01_002164 [Tephrocybe rancida]